MGITFDTLDELIEFSNLFELKHKLKSQQAGKMASGYATRPNSSALLSGTTTEERVKKASELTEAVQNEEGTDKRKKNYPATKIALRVYKHKKTGAQRISLTSKIQQAIQERLNKDLSFTANDIADDLQEAEPNVPINKQSIITSVLKQMNSTFASVEVDLVAGNGPRPVKLYNP
jgi:hypothetical protein